MRFFEKMVMDIRSTKKDARDSYRSLTLLLSKYYEDGQINEEELRGTCSMYGIEVTRTQNIGSTPAENTLLGRHIRGIFI
jgi:hypothetical protein